MQLRSTVNGEPRTTQVDGAESAVEVIRDGFGLTGTKLVCGSGGMRCLHRAGRRPAPGQLSDPGHPVA